VASIACPHCGEKTFTWRDKYQAGKWAVLRCAHCGGRVCAQPIVLSILYFFYLWDLMLFGYLAYLDTAWYLLVLLVVWLVLDYCSLYVPFTALRARPRGA
jgi:DNA-directed RNA polymerase subunit RPC12/RpoP